MGWHWNLNRNQTDLLITLRRFADPDLPQLRRWFGHEAVRKRISAPDANWLTHIRSDNVTCYTICDVTGAMIGFIQVDKDGADDLWFDMIIAPWMQNKGIGTKALQQLCAQTKSTALCATVEPDNAASIRCLIKSGFMADSAPDTDGFRIYRKTAP